MRLVCPKCGSKCAWYERTPIDVTLRCMCGYNKVIFTALETVEVSESESEQEIRLPKEHTNLWYTIVVLFVLKMASSAEITERLVDLGKDFTVSDVSSYLTILRSKKLVRTVESRRGRLGGSIWSLTEGCSLLVDN